MLEFCFGKTRTVLHFSFFAVLLLTAELLRSDWGLWCAGACLLHETGHILAYASLGAAPREVHFACGGIRIVPPGKPLSPARETLVLVSGSAVNLLIGGALLTLNCRYAAGFHLLLGAFNLLPLTALDGGQLLRLLAEQRLSLWGAAILCQTASVLTLLPLLWGGWQLFRRTGNFTLLLTLCYLMILSIASHK